MNTPTSQQSAARDFVAFRTGDEALACELWPAADRDLRYLATRTETPASSAARA